MFSVRAIAARRGYGVKFSQNIGQEPKPKISEFKYCLFHTFLVASGTFMALNAVWYTLEYQAAEKELIAESSRLEDQLQSALEEAKSGMDTGKKWYSLAFWRS